MPTSTALISKTISKSATKSTSKSKAMAKAMYTESTTNNQIRAASQRATQTSHAKEVFISRAHLQLFCQKVTDNMEDAESKAFISKLYMEAAAESMQMGMGLELHTCPAPVVGGDYDDACSDSDDEAPPPAVSSEPKPKPKPVKGRGSGTSRPGMKGKRCGWNLCRKHLSTEAPPAEFVARDAALTPEQRSEKTDKDKPAHPLWTKENGTKFTDAGMFESWKNMTDEQKASWNEQAADEWKMLVDARARADASAPSGSDDQMIVEDPDDAELPVPLGGAASAEESDDNDAPPPPPTSKSKRPVEEPAEEEPAAEEPAAEKPPAAKRKSKRSGAGRKSVRIATPAEEEPAEEEPAEEEPAEEEPAEEPVEEEPVEEATTAEDLFGEE